MSYEVANIAPFPKQFKDVFINHSSIFACNPFIYFLFWAILTGLWDLSSRLGLNPHFGQWKCWIITTRPPVNSPHSPFHKMHKPLVTPAGFWQMRMPGFLALNLQTVGEVGPLIAHSPDGKTGPYGQSEATHLGSRTWRSWSCKPASSRPYP